METEYIIRYRPRSETGSRPSDERLFRKLAQALKKVLPLIPASAEDDSYFAANGSGLSFERSLRFNGTGLIEGATPECFSPRDLLIAQRAQDQMLADAAKTVGDPDAEFVLLKNNRDKNGNTYGCHENYETVFATGIRLKIWQAVVIMLYPSIILGWILMIILALLLILISLFLGWVAYRIARLLFPKKKKRKLLKRFGWSFEDPGIWAPWNVFWQFAIFAVTLAPSILILMACARLFAFHPIRKALIPFMVTRPSWSGAGWLNSKGQFFLQQKPARCMVGEGVIWHRPIIHIAHLVEIFVVNPLNLKQYKTLLNARQRLQISFSDSNMCEEAEYLKIATTRLLLDAVEAGALKKIPRLWRPLKVSKMIGRGILKKPVANFDGEKLDAIAVQKYFCSEIENYLLDFQIQNDETREILSRWKAILDGLDVDRQSLVGRVDWVTKRFLLEELDSTLSLSARRKVDFKYHELSPEGYFFCLAGTGIVNEVATPEEIERAKRLPPAGTRAAVRGRYIREFASSKKTVRMNWDSIVIGEGKTREVIDLPRED